MANPLAKHKVNKKSVPDSYHIKKGDTVMVIAGKDSGKTGIVKVVQRKTGKAIVEGLNLVKKAVRPNPMLGDRGGIVAREAPIYVSKLMVYDLKSNKATRTRMESTKDGRKVRVGVKTKEQIDV